MADPDLVQVRSSEQLTVTILRARNLKGQRGDTVNALVKVEFGEKSLGESPKVVCIPETPAEFNYQTTINVTFEDPLALDELATKPVLCTVIEVLPKEKKQKEEKTVILGQSTVDLMPLIVGETKYKHTLPINPTPDSPLEKLGADQPKPELDIQLSVNEPIITENQLKDVNLASVTLESLYSPPEGWGVSGPQYTYTAVTPIPLGAEKENAVVFAGGQLKPGVDKEPPSKQKKWAMPGAAQLGATFIQDSTLPADNLEDEDGDFKAKEDREHRAAAEQDKNRVLWNIERRCYMDSHASKSLQERIAKTRYWPLELFRTSLQGGAKGKKDDDGVTFHGVAYINLAPLLYPGVKRIRGAYKVVGFMENELAEKTQRKGSMADDAVRIANGILSRSGSSPFPKAGKKEESKGKDPKKGAQKGKNDPQGQDKGQLQSAHPSSSHLSSHVSAHDKPSTLKATDSASETDSPAVNVEGQQYADSKSYVMLEISLQRPLIPKRPAEELAKRVAEYVPPRPKFPKRTDGAQRSVEDFQNQVGVAANLILDEFRDQFGEIFTSGKAVNTAEAMEDRKQKLIYHLNTTGKYFAFKEQLKHAVVKIVREKYLKTSAFTDKDELQAFLSELYVYLIDQMHIGLGKVLNIEDQNPIPEPLTDSAQLKHFAREAEVNENFELAAKYYQERIARDRNDPDHWMDYGTFCLYINDLTKAEECFKECVSVDQRHLYGLLLYGVVCTMQDKHEAAETFFEAATTFEPKSILAWTMLGLFYDGIGNEIGAEMALMEANKLNVSAAADLAKSSVETAAEPPQEASPPEVTAEGEDRPPEGATAEEGEKPDGAATTGQDGELPDQDKEPGLGVATVSDVPLLRQLPPSPINSVAGSEKIKPSVRESRHNSAARKSGKMKGSETLSSRPGSLRGRSPLSAPQEEPHTAPEDAPPPREATPIPTQTIFMHVVELLLEVKAMPFTERALAHHLLDPAGGPSTQYHISLARLKLQKHQMEEAEDSLKEALQFDHQSPDAWAILGHIKYLVGDTTTAKDCYERTLAFIADASEMHSIYLRLASIYLQEGRFQEAKSSFLMACKRSPSCVSWLGVGIACYRLGELSESEDALAEANILNNSDPEVWAYLSLVCLKTGRQLEAEQSYKYALKLNLQDEDLLGEINQLQEEVGFGNPAL